MFRTATIQSLRRAQYATSKTATIHNDQTLSLASITARSLVTAAQKRALNNDQIKGTTAEAASTVAKTSTTATKSSTSSVEKPSSPSGGGDGGGGSSIVVPLLALAAASAAGGAYYMDLIPMAMGGDTKKDAEKAPVVENLTAEKTPKVKAVVKVEEPTVAKDETKAKDSAGNRVINIYAPPSSGRKSEPIPPVEHSPNGNRVSVERFSKVYGSSEPSPTPEVVPIVQENFSPVIPTLEAEKELTSVSSSNSKIDNALKQAHVTMRATLDDTFLKDLDKLNDNELRIRVVQLASEMGERTKWEAIRLREFLGMKEKEVEDKFLDLMQKQRLEFEDLLARRLREQEYVITKQANEAIDAKDKTLETVIDAAASAQKAEYEAALKITEERLERELNAKYEADFGQKLAEAKSDFVNELEKNVSVIDSLTQRLEKNEQNLEISRNFESGSQRAHRVSAAALALAAKMETSKAAMEEFIALKAAASENGVIASALDKIPDSVKTGIPTLPELQATFEHSHKISRQAAYVPSGLGGVEGQFAGMVFSNLSVQPSPDSVPPESDSSDIPDAKMSDFILARAKEYVKVGQLESAVNELDKLKGQSSFTINDWKVAALNRIAVDQALKVIKMECALMNKNMSG